MIGSRGRLSGRFEEHATSHLSNAAAVEGRLDLKTSYDFTAVALLLPLTLLAKSNTPEGN
jgi:hypothetical protein